MEPLQEQYFNMFCLLSASVQPLEGFHDAIVEAFGQRTIEESLDTGILRDNEEVRLQDVVSSHSHIDVNIRYRGTGCEALIGICDGPFPKCDHSLPSFAI